MFNRIRRPDARTRRRQRPVARLTLTRPPDVQPRRARLLRPGSCFEALPEGVLVPASVERARNGASATLEYQPAGAGLLTPVHPRGPLVPCRCQHRPATTPYCSPWCRIGTHADCRHSSPPPAPPGVPVVYETCCCTCHATEGRATARGVAG